MKRPNFGKAIASLVVGLVCSVLVLSFSNCSWVGSPPDGGTPTHKGVETGNPMNPIAATPKIFINSDYPQLPDNHRVLTVGARGRDFTDCQAAVNAAAPGDEVVIDARYVCPTRLILPDKGPSEHFVVIRTANLGALPPEGTRISKGDAANLAVIESKNDGYAVGISDLPSGSTVTSAANHYYLLGLEIRVNSAVKVANAHIVKLRNGGKNLDQLPHNIVIARSWIHGNPDQEIRRGIDMNGLQISVIDSIIEEIHQHRQSSQGIVAWDAAVGPYKITNNEFAVAGAALLIGWESSIPDLIPSDIEVRKNLFHKLDAWKTPVTSNAGMTGYWELSETIILRSVQRILFDGNIFESDFVEPNTNHLGCAFYLSPSGFGQPWARVQDVTITNNIMRDIPAGFRISYQDKTMPAVITQRVHIENNVAYNLDPDNHNGFIWLQGQAEGPIAFNHNTFLSSPHSPPITIVGDRNGMFGQITFTNNIINDQGDGILGLGSPGAGAQTLRAQFPSIDFHHNVLAGQSPADYLEYSADNAFPAGLEAIGFAVDLSAGIPDYRVLRLQSSSPYANSGDDGADIGADIQSISEAIK